MSTLNQSTGNASLNQGMAVDGSDSIGHFAKIKIRIYQRTLLIAVLVILVVWGLSFHNNILTNVEFYIYPFFLLFCLVSLMLFKKHGTRFLKPFENAGFGFVFIYFLLQFSLEISAGIENPALDFRKFLLWIAVLYTFAFLIFPSLKALQWSLFYIFFATLSLVSYTALKNLGQMDWKTIC